MFTTTRPAIALMLALGTFAALIGTYLSFVGTAPGQYLDQTAMRAVSAAFGVDGPVSGALGEYQLPALALTGGAVGTVVAGRRSVAVAVTAAITLALAVAGAFLLKALLVRPSFEDGVQLNSFPSNTVAVFAVLGVILVISVPRCGRIPATVIAVTIAAVVSVLVVAQQWHRPSDVIGAWLVAGCAAATARTARAAWAWTSDVERSMTGGQAAAHRG